MLAKFQILLLSILLANVYGLELCSPTKPIRNNFPPAPPHLQQQYSAENLAKIDEMQAKSNELRKKICDLNAFEARDFSEKINECNKLNHISRIEELLKPCRNLRMISNNNKLEPSYLEFERQECQYEECHFKVMNSPQYQNIMQELERLTPEQRLTNDHKRFKCVMEVLGLK